MSFPTTPDLGHAALAGAVALLAGAAAFFKSRAGGLALRVSELEAKFDQARTAPKYWEYRIDRFDAIWFASVAAVPEAKAIIAVSPGVPNCKNCVAPLATTGGRSAWTCPACGKAHADSLVDVTVTDAIVKLALDQFKESHRDFRRL